MAAKMAEAAQLVRIIRQNAPERDPAGTIQTGIYKSGKRAGKPWKRKAPYAIKSHGVVISPRPGNLKRNGSELLVDTEEEAVVRHGVAVPYAKYANITSRKPHYIEKSISQFQSFLLKRGWEVDNER